MLSGCGGLALARARSAHCLGWDAPLSGHEKKISRLSQADLLISNCLMEIKNFCFIYKENKEGEVNPPLLFHSLFRAPRADLIH